MCFRSVRLVQFIQSSSRTLPALTRIDQARSVWLGLISVHRVSNGLGGAEGAVLGPPTEIPARRPRVCRLGGGMWSLLACLLARPGCGVVSERRKSSSKSLKKSSFSSVRQPNRAGCQFVQFSSGLKGKVSPSSSFRLVHLIPLTNTSGPGCSHCFSVPYRHSASSWPPTFSALLVTLLATYSPSFLHPRSHEVSSWLSTGLQPVCNFPATRRLHCPLTFS